MRQIDILEHHTNHAYEAFCKALETGDPSWIGASHVAPYDYVHNQTNYHWTTPLEEGGHIIVDMDQFAHTVSMGKLDRWRLQAVLSIDSMARIGHNLHSEFDQVEFPGLRNPLIEEFFSDSCTRFKLERLRSTACQYVDKDQFGVILKAWEYVRSVYDPAWLCRD